MVLSIVILWYPLTSVILNDVSFEVRISVVLSTVKLYVPSVISIGIVVVLVIAELLLIVNDADAMGVKINRISSIFRFI